MDIRKQIEDLKTIIDVAQLPVAVDSLLADLDASGLLNSQAVVVEAEYQAAINAATARFDFEEVARLVNQGHI